MAEKRGLFQSIFGKKQQSDKDFHAYKLLSSWESTFSPYSGNMWDINTVRSAVDAFARRASTAQPRHVRQSPETTVSVNDYVDRILQYQPNPYMTAADFITSWRHNTRSTTTPSRTPSLTVNGGLWRSIPSTRSILNCLNTWERCIAGSNSQRARRISASIPALSTSADISSKTIFSGMTTAR